MSSACCVLRDVVQERSDGEFFRPGVLSPECGVARHLGRGPRPAHDTHQTIEGRVVAGEMALDGGHACERFEERVHSHHHDATLDLRDVRRRSVAAHPGNRRKDSHRHQRIAQDRSSQLAGAQKLRFRGECVQFGRGLGEYRNVFPGEFRGPIGV